MGLEALMCGREVHCFGMPVYAGWGLTKDRLTLARRSRKVTLEELLHALYVRFTVYIHSITGKICSVEEFIKVMVELRTNYTDQMLTAGSK
jgi:capsular polysaccharide export protein